MSAVDLQVREMEQEQCCELVALRAATAAEFGSDWPLEPGAVRLASSGQPELLHFAPGRWLVPDPSEALLGRLGDHAAATLVDVEGKWRRLALQGAGAARALGASIPVESVLAGRECAAVAIFDCPAVLRRAGEGFEVWVLSSYVASFNAALARVHSRQQSRE